MDWAAIGRIVLYIFPAVFLIFLVIIWLRFTSRCKKCGKWGAVDETNI